MQALSHYLKHNGLRGAARRRLVDYKVASFKARTTNDVLAGFPAAVRTQILEKRYASALRRTHVFEGVSQRVVHEALGRAREETFLDGMVLGREGDLPDTAYLVHFRVATTISSTRVEPVTFVASDFEQKRSRHHIRCTRGKYMSSCPRRSRAAAAATSSPSRRA